MANRTIGTTIEQLFPNGFYRDQYHCIFKTEIPRKEGDQDLEILNFMSTFLGTDEAIDAPDVGSERHTTYSDLCRFRTKEIKDIHKFSMDDKYVLPPFSPFDMFAISSTLLLNSGAYHHFEPCFDSDKDYNIPNRVKIIRPSEIEMWKEISCLWRELSDYPDREDIDVDVSSPKSITGLWISLLSHWNDPVHNTISEYADQPNWWYTVMCLHAISDDTSLGVGFVGGMDVWPTFAGRIMEEFSHEEPGLWHTISPPLVESISLADRNEINVLPKSRTAQLGCTLRGLSFNLAKLPGKGKIRVGWSPTITEPSLRKNPVFNMLLVPYPYEIHSFNFKATKLNNDAGLRWGYFSTNIIEDDEADMRFVEFVGDLLKQSDERVGKTHGIVLPELAISLKSAINIINMICKRHPSIEFCCFGVREKFQKDIEKVVAVNGALMGLFEDGKIHQSFFHQKHHRWCLNEDQIDMYGLSPALDPSRTWWEDIRLTNRSIPFLVLRNKWSVTSLICEDLARNDPAREVVEAIGPNLVISLLMDGPQISSRWSARYATVLAEDPGSSVLSISSFGLIKRSNIKAKEKNIIPSRSFALWRDDNGKSTEIALKSGHHAAVVSITEFPRKELTFDGRQADDRLSLRLTGIRQIKSGVMTELEPYPAWSPRRG